MFPACCLARLLLSNVVHQPENNSIIIIPFHCSIIEGKLEAENRKDEAELC